MNGSGSCLTDGALAPPVRLRYGEKERPHLTTLAPGSWTSGVQTMNKFLLFISNPICGVLSQHPEWTTTTGYRRYRQHQYNAPQNSERGVRLPSMGSTPKSPYNQLER